MNTATSPSKIADQKNMALLQRAIVDGLEDVKAQDIQVFDTAHLTALFERVIIATATSARQTRALAVSVRDAVREAGFAKPRTEGEENGEWIVVDCGQAVVHVMQPAIRQYYRLEELWGEKAVHPLPRAATAKTVKNTKTITATAKKPPAKKATSISKTPAARTIPAKKTATAKAAVPAKKTPSKTLVVGKPATKQAKKAIPSKTPARTIKGA